MSRSNLLARGAIIAAVTVAALASGGEAQAQYRSPPPAYVASYSPIYYRGYAHYYYGGRWFYRDHAAWRSYDRDPDYLRDRRGEWGRHLHHWR